MRVLLVCACAWLALLTACNLAETPAPLPTRRPTRTPAPITPEPTATSIPAATPDVTAELCPLTGLRDTGKAWTLRRPLLFKIDNSPLARPQSGIANADIVVEHLTEGGVTRFNAVFWCSDADSIGPIRSARLIDLELVSLFQGVLAHVGASNENLANLREAFGNRLMDEGVDKAPFNRVKERDAPYNTYTSSQGVRVLLPQRGISQTDIQLKGLSFREAPPAGVPTDTAAQVVIPYDKRFSDSVWEYAPEQAQYKKFLLGEPLVDAQTGRQVHAANVVVLFAQHTATDIVEDALGSRSLHIALKGKGRVVVFRDGQAFEGQWMRDDPGGFIRFVDADHRDIALKPGRSWWEVAPTDLKLEWK